MVKLVRIILEMPWKGMCGCTNQCSRWKIHCAVTNVCRNMPHNHKLVRLGGVSLCDCECLLEHAPRPQIGSGGKRFTSQVASICCGMHHSHWLVRPGRDLGSRIYPTTMDWFGREEILDLEYTPLPWIGSTGKRSLI
jgi:hypothetical protein